ncbi:hypothetical protein, partial [Rheinheimera faecalis]|uniref:hypothetical protein n=1 Tax=Rheinheimera faecalis TaxID=2901141 RepID=UPI001E4E9757
VAVDAFGNAIGNSIVAGLSTKSGPAAENGKLSAKEQAELDKKMVAMDKQIQAKLNGQSGANEPVIQMQSQNGVLVPQGSNPVEIFDWYQENGFLESMGDKQYHQLAVAANAYEDKSMARIQASMDYSQMLQQDLKYKQFSVDASAYRLAQSAQEMKYYALGGWEQGSNNRSLVPITSELKLNPNPMKQSEDLSLWGDVSTAAGYAGAYFEGLDQAVIGTGKSKAIGVLQNAGALWAGKQTQIATAKGIEGAMSVSSATAKSTQQAARFATAAKMTGPLALAAGGVEVFADTMAAPEGQGIKYGVASAGALVAGTLGTSLAYYAGVTGTMLLFANPIGAVVVGGALAFGAAWSWNEYASGDVKAFFRGEPMN